MANRKKHITPDERVRTQQQRVIKPPQSEVVTIDEFLVRIWGHYDKANTVPDLLPTPYKNYLLGIGHAEYLPNTEKPYVVFSEKGSQMYQAWWIAKYRKKGRAA